MAWAKARRVAENTAMTNPARLKPLRGEDAQTDVRTEKVERLRAAIAEGRYRVSSGALADKLIEQMRTAGAEKKRKA